MSRLHQLAALLFVPWLTGCLDVPQVSFGPDATADAPSDETSAPDDAPAEAQDGAADAAPADAKADAQPDGASDAGTCPDALSPGAAWCCASVPCKGPTAAACQSECTNCENDCPGQTCCLDKHGNYQGCAATPAACP
ncbi:MAG TPA: hypothetical protein VF765_26725, partial [Polyangiaceae bacterium]